jgi:hypothetical protein
MGKIRDVKEDRDEQRPLIIIKHHLNSEFEVASVSLASMR